MVRKQGSGDSEDHPPVVLGLELARAHEAEAAHRDEHQDEASPLADLTYDNWSGELDLARFRPNTMDGSIRTRLASWTGTQAAARARDQLAMTDFYTLLAFARRAVVRSVREADPRWALSALAALPVVACDRIDWRDHVVASAMVAWALKTRDHPVAALFEQAADEADEQAASTLRRFAAKPPTDLRTEWGLEPIDSAYGWGLADRRNRPYEPSLDLVTASVLIADVLDADHYLANRITVAETMPDVWVRGPRLDVAQAAIEGTRGCVSVSTYPRPETGFEPMDQMLTVWVAEMASNADAATVAEAASSSTEDHVRLAAHYGPACCIAIARSTQLGGTALEDQTTIDRLAPTLRSALIAAGV